MQSVKTIYATSQLIIEFFENTFFNRSHTMSAAASSDDFSKTTLYIYSYSTRNRDFADTFRVIFTRLIAVVILFLAAIFYNIK